MVALFLSFRIVSILSLRQDEFQIMTELAACAIALMLTIELAVAIACAVAWLAAREAGESDLSDRHDRSAAGHLLHGSAVISALLTRRAPSR